MKGLEKEKWPLDFLVPNSTPPRNSLLYDNIMVGECVHPGVVALDESHVDPAQTDKHILTAV